MNKDAEGGSSILTVPRLPVQGRTNPFSLRRLEGGEVTIRDELAGETFHPVIGAMREARELYVEQTFLAQCWENPATREKTVWDVGLGAAANAIAAYDSWSGGSHGNLHVESFDISRAALCFALGQAKEHPDSFAYLAGWDWDRMMKDKCLLIHRGTRTFSWRFHEGDFRASCLLPELRRPDLVMYDLYSAPKCPGLYSLGHWETLRKRLGGHDSLVVLHTRSTVVRVTMALAGWYVGAGRHLGEKEETTLAATKPQLLPSLLGPDWLGKVQRSTSASPILAESMEKGPVSAFWFERLKSHPQWAGRSLRNFS